MPTSEQYSVFRAYLDSRHHDGGMADMTVLDYAMMVEDSHVETKMVEYRLRTADTGGRGGELLGGRAHATCSATASRWSIRSTSPTAADRSLGTLMILDHISRARRMGLAYVYLGYWVRGSRKMDYKGRFLPQERLMAEGWVRVEN